MLKCYERSLNGQVIYVRHAQTNYNLFTEEMKILKSIRLEEKYLDCDLSNEGILEAENLFETLKNFDIKYCFTSPLIRCLETSFISLKNHQNVKNIEVIVHPLLNEIISSTQTITKPIKAKKEKYNIDCDVKYNWSIFENYFKEESEQNFFFFNFIDYNIIESLKELVTQIKFSTKDGLISQFLDIFWKNGVRPETFNSLLSRTKTFKNFLNEFIKEKQIPENEKILVFTHGGFIKMSTSNIVSSSEKILNFPEDGYAAKNCETISITLINE